MARYSEDSTIRLEGPIVPPVNDLIRDRFPVLVTPLGVSVVGVT